MPEPVFDPLECRSRRGVSAPVAFVVVAISVAAVLAVALSERHVAYEAGATIRLVASASTESIAKPSAQEVRSAFSKHYEAAAGDEFLDSDSPGKSDGSRHVAIAVRSAEPDGLPARLNDAARRLVDAQNAAITTSMDAQLNDLKKQTTTRRDEHTSAAKQLEELVRRAKSRGNSAELGDLNGETLAPAINKPREATRDVNPQWVLLRDEVAALEAKVSELRGRFTEQHPEVQHALVALTERSSQLQAMPQYLGGIDAAPADAAPTNQPPTFAAPENPPLVAPQSDSVAAASPDEATPGADPSDAEIESARAKVAAASEALDKAWAAEKAAEQRQIDLAALGPWRFEPAESVRNVASGATQTPWLVVLGASLGAGLVASLLARGIAPVIGSREDAVAALGLQVVGIVHTDDPAPPVHADAGVVSAQWLTRAGIVAIAAIVAIVVIAANGSGIGAEELRNDPSVLLSLSRDWLVERLG